MSAWYRIFGTSEVQPQPAALLEQLQAGGREVTGHFRGDERGWFAAELVLPGIALKLEHYLAGEDEIRAELNGWAAWLELAEDNPHHGALMRHMIQTRQLFTLQAAAEEGAEEVEKRCVEVCCFLAQETAGVYQVDGQGFFAADGTLLVAEAGGEHDH